MTVEDQNVVIVTREELYEKVWSMPLTQLSPTFGVSHILLAKICDDHKVPRPERGYWSKRAFGKAPAPPSLPPCDNEPLRTVRIQKDEPKGSNEQQNYVSELVAGVTPKPPHPPYDPDVLRCLRRARALSPVVISDTLRGLQPLVQATRDALEGGNTDPRGRRQPRPHQHGPFPLNVAVYESSVRRALLFLDALVKAVFKAGGRVEVEQSNWKRKTVVSFCGEEVATLRLWERYRQRPRTTPPKDSWDWSKCEYVPTGRLVLDGGDSFFSYCEDTESGKRVLGKRIEDAINDLVISWAEGAGRARVSRRNAKEEARRRAEAEWARWQLEADLQRRRDELQARQAAEQARVDRLLRAASAWCESQNVRAYIQAMEQRALNRDGVIEPGSEIDRWLCWARDQADRLDPLTPSPSSILDERL